MERSEEWAEMAAEAEAEVALRRVGREEHVAERAACLGPAQCPS